MSSMWMDWRARTAIAVCLFGVACGSDSTGSSGGRGNGGDGAASGAGGAFPGTGGVTYVPTGGAVNVATGGTGNVATGGTGNVATGGASTTGGFGGMSVGGMDAGATDADIDASVIDASADASAGGGDGDSGGPGGTSGTGGVGTGGVGTGGVGTGGVGTGGVGTGGVGTGGVGTGGVGTGGVGTGGVGTGGVGTGGVGTGGGGPSCSGRPGVLQGYSTQSIMVGLVQRTFVYYAPPTLDPNQPAPLVIVPHGYTMSGQIMYDITGYKDVADREGFVAVFPDGTVGNPWNCGTGICGAGAFVNGTGDDQGFMDALIEFVDDDQCLDRDHVFMSGFSMGGYFTNESGCLRSDLAAIGPHSGGSHVLTSCPGSIKPVILFHFDNDALIAYSCGTEARDRWVARNGCSLTAPQIRTVLNGSCAYYQGCDAGGQVTLCTFTGGIGPAFVGHGWAGGAAGGYSVVDAENAAELGWAFFKEFAW